MLSKQIMLPDSNENGRQKTIEKYKLVTIHLIFSFSRQIQSLINLFDQIVSLFYSQTKAPRPHSDHSFE